MLGLSLACAFSIVAFFSFWADVERVATLLTLTGVGALMLSIGVTAQALYKVVRIHWGQRALTASLVHWLLRHRIVVGVWVLCSIVSLSLFPMGNRVLMDEIVVLCTSRAIHEEREALTPQLLTGQNGVHKLTDGYIDKRPYLYATIVSFFHDLLGYSPTNAFYANMLLGALTLALLGAVGTKLSGDQTGGILAMLTLTSVPLFCEHVTGGGIDILNLFSMLLVLLLAIHHMERPSAWTVQALLGAGVLLAYSRYESLLFMVLPVVIVGVVLLRDNRFYWNWPTLLLWSAIVPLMGVHYLTFSRSVDSFQLVELGNSPAFSLLYIPENLAHAVAFFLDPEHILTNSAVVFVAGLVAFLLLVVANVGRSRHLRKLGAGVVFWTFASLVLVSFALLMAYSWGALDQPIGSRLSLPLYLLLSLSIAAVSREMGNRRRFTFVVAAILIGSLYWSSFPVAAKNYAHRFYPIGRTLAVMDEFNARQPDRRFAVVNGLTNYWVTRDVLVIPPTNLQKNPESLAYLLRSKYYQRVYLIEVLIRDPNTGKFAVQTPDVLPVSLDTELISEEPASNVRRVRISLVKESSIAKLIPAPQRRKNLATDIQVNISNEQPLPTRSYPFAAATEL